MHLDIPILYVDLISFLAEGAFSQGILYQLLGEQKAKSRPTKTAFKISSVYYIDNCALLFFIFFIHPYIYTSGHWGYRCFSSKTCVTGFVINLDCLAGFSLDAP